MSQPIETFIAKQARLYLGGDSFSVQDNIRYIQPSTSEEISVNSSSLVIIYETVAEIPNGAAGDDYMINVDSDIIPCKMAERDVLNARIISSKMYSKNANFNVTAYSFPIRVKYLEFTQI